MPQTVGISKRQDLRIARRTREILQAHRNEASYRQVLYQTAVSNVSAAFWSATDEPSRMALLCEGAEYLDLEMEAGRDEEKYSTACQGARTCKSVSELLALGNPTVFEATMQALGELH